MKIRKPIYIFDLDGTLANVEHRRALLDDKADPHRWKKFYAACVNDTPNRAVINTLHYLARMVDVEVRIWSGRSDEVKEETLHWLREHVRLPAVIETLRMRPMNDYTPDEQLKKAWLDELSSDERSRLIATFDDRDRVVRMWREAGVACFQVAAGNF